MDGRTRVFQWIADHYPTHRMANSKLLQLPWRAALATLRPRAPIVMRLTDYRMLLDPVQRFHGRGILHRGRVEPTMTDHFRRGIRAGMTIVDAGANVGHYSLVAARALAGTGTIYAFEPEPGNFACLQKNIGLNEFQNIEARREAVSDRAGTATLHLHAEGAGAHSLEAGNVVAGGTLDVATTRLDDLLAGRTLDVLKMDVQGAEGWILDGATEVLGRSNTAIYAEYTPLLMRRCGTDPRGFLNKLKELGYTPQALFDSGVRTDGLEALLYGCADSEDYRVAYNLFFGR